MHPVTSSHHIFPRQHSQVQRTQNHHHQQQFIPAAIDHIKTHQQQQQQQSSATGNSGPVILSSSSSNNNVLSGSIQVHHHHNHHQIRPSAQRAYHPLPSNNLLHNYNPALGIEMLWSNKYPRPPHAEQPWFLQSPRNSHSVMEHTKDR